MEKKILTFLLIVMCAIAAQAKTVKGTVIDQVNEPVIGASVTVVGTTNGTVTDFDGNFVLNNVADGATIKFSFMGMQAKELKAQDVMNVQLMDDVKNLDEVVVIGYGSAQAKDLRRRPWLPCKARWPV